MPNHYETLGVSKDATDKEIKQAYRALSMKYHPDKVKAEDLEEANVKMREINEAYSVIGDAESRQQYNAELDNPFLGQGFPPGFPGQGFPGQGFPPGFPGQGFPQGLFEMLFANGGGPEIHFFQSQMRPPIVKNIEITLAQSFSGLTVENPIDSTMSIHIPAGIRDGNNIIIQNANGPDVHLRIHVTNNTQFIRQSNDLVYKHKVSLKEALCGFKFQIDHLNGNKLNLNVNVVVFSGAKQIIKQLGFPGGDLIIEFEVTFPEHLSQEQKEAIANIL
jgi:DnaJ-class molecular chaperone